MGIGRENGPSSPVEWVPANCPACGLISVNVADLDGELVYHEYGAVVELYSRSGVMPEPRHGLSCPECGERNFAFSPVES
ncbi:MAG: hypothetical protein J4N98_05190 [Chloroflexi bacterium]|nr:hypothetical protein [Chloroflexota bacterium]